MSVGFFVVSGLVPGRSGFSVASLQTGLRKEGVDRDVLREALAEPR
jgi:hypothetical protein